MSEVTMCTPDKMKQACKDTLFALLLCVLPLVSSQILVIETFMCESSVTHCQYLMRMLVPLSWLLFYLHKETHGGPRQLTKENF